MSRLSLDTLAAGLAGDDLAGIVRWYVPGTSREDAEDALQDAWLLATIKTGELEPGNLRGWLLTVAATAARRYRDKRHPIRYIEDLPSADEWEGAAPDLFLAIEARELLAAVARQKPIHRDVLAAAMRGDTTGDGGARTRLTRARNAIRDELGEAKPERIDWNRDRVICAYRRFAESKGRPPSAGDLNRNPDLPCESMVRKLFGTTNRALVAAGFEARVPAVSGGGRQWTETQALDALREYVDRRGFVPSQGGVNRDHRLPSVSTYRKLFGTYSNAVRRAGFEPNEPTVKAAA